MGWAEAMKDQASVASRDRVYMDAIVLRSTPAIPWDPYEVLLTRVKQPRERAANRLAADSERHARGLPV